MSVDTKICPSCSTDLTLFSAEDAIDDLKPEDMKSMLSGENGHLTDLLKAAEDEPLPSKDQPSEILFEDMAECPECGKPISATAESCPHCGVQFEVEEVFECPMCKSLLGLTVTKCPSCGTEFEPMEPAPAPEPQKASPPPVQAPKPDPVKASSFVDRLKLIKDEPGQAPQPAAPAPKKELSFAERMKAMKEGKPVDENAPVSPAPAKETAPVSQPVKESPPAAKPSPPPSTVGTNIADRLKNLQQAAPVTAQQPPATSPPKPAPQPTQPADQPRTKDEQYRELPRYIGEVKKLLMLANEMKIDVSTSKAVINRAVTAGKTRDMQTAITLVKEGKTGIEKELRAVYLSKLRTMESVIGLEKKSGKAVSELERIFNETRKSLEVGDFQTTSDSLKSMEEQMMKTSPSRMSEAELDTVSCAISNAEFLHLNVEEAKTLFDAARNAAAGNDSQKSVHFTAQANESLNKILPSYISGEMRKAKLTLRDIKMMNIDISQPVQMLKEANDHVMRGDYCSALAHIKAFKEYVQKAQE